jgi:hypothetical protein
MAMLVTDRREAVFVVHLPRHSRVAHITLHLGWCRKMMVLAGQLGPLMRATQVPSAEQFQAAAGWGELLQVTADLCSAVTWQALPSAVLSERDGPMFM